METLLALLSLAIVIPIITAIVIVIIETFKQVER